MSANPGLPHEERRRTLDALAILGGCREPLLPFLPDGRCPDVLRFDSERRHLFVGDAKDTETPGCSETRARLVRYASWLRANTLVGGSGTLALCHPAAGGVKWAELLESVAREQGFRDVHWRQRRLDADAVVSWVDLSLPPTAERGQATSRSRRSAPPTCAATA
ncbi:MAG TPA: hypothetical protein VFL61_05965 [Gaiellaceae bacterium]|nr:hypothetical protein [Gaiellaceae bacterium]